MGLCAGQSDPLPRLLFPDQHPLYRRPRERPVIIDDDPSASRADLPRLVDGV